MKNNNPMHNLTEEQYNQWRAKKAKQNRQIAVPALKRWWNNLSEQEKLEHKRKQSESNKKIWEKRSEVEKEQIRKKNSEGTLKYYANQSDTERYLHQLKRAKTKYYTPAGICYTMKEALDKNGITKDQLLGRTVNPKFPEYCREPLLADEKQQLIEDLEREIKLQK